MKHTGLFERSDDAAAMFEGEKEENWPWEERDLPMKILKRFSLSRETVKRDKERIQNIRLWMNRAGGVYKALVQSPLILRKTMRKAELVDGWHRLHVARKLGAKKIRAIIVHEPLSLAPFVR